MRSERRRRFGLRAGLVVLASGIAMLFASALRRGGKGRSDDDRAPGEEIDATGRGRPAAPPTAVALKDGHETLDADPRSIGLIMVVGVSTIAASIAGLFVLLGFLHARDAERRPPLTSQQRAAIVPPGPPLQSSPQYDLASLGTMETKKLQGYRWLDASHRRAQIPIERAMSLVIGRSLDPSP